MKKLTAMLLALTMACGVLAGCNGTPSIPGEESSTPSSSAPAESSKAESSTPEVTEKNFDGVTVKVWGGDLLNNPDFEAFWAENAGGMKYEVVQADDVKMMSMVASGTAPDVWVLSAFSMGAMYAARGLYEPLDDYIANSDVFDMDNLADVESLYRFDGQEVGKGSTYGIVKDWSLDNQLFINKNVFNDCGIPIPDDKTVYTWDQIRDWAKQMIKFDEDGNQIRWGLASSNDLYQLIAAQLGSIGKSLWSDDLRSANLDTPEVRAAFEYWVDMYKSNAFANSVTGGPGDWGGDSFAVDKVGMMNLGYWFGNGTLAFNDNAKDHLDDYMLIQAPSLDASKQANACLAGVGGSIWAGSKNKDAAFRLLELYLGGEWAEKMAKRGYGNPAQLDLVELLPQETSFQKQTYDANAFGLQNMITLKTNPFVTSQGMSSAFSQYFNEVLFDRMTLDDAIAGMQNEFNTMIQEGLEICGIN